MTMNNSIPEGIVRLTRQRDEAVAALAAERARADQANPRLSVDEFREAVGAERASHAARGYDTAHDRTHGVPHLLRWALDYASRGESVKSGALIVAAIHLSEELEREERGARAERDALRAALLSAPHDALCAWRETSPSGMRLNTCTCWKSVAPTVEQ